MELIDRDALKERMLSYYDCVNPSTAKENYRGETLMNYEVADMIMDCIDNAPVIDAKPVVHGEWIDVNDWKQKCSVCGYGREQFNSNFCANCGAKMEVNK